MRHGALDFPTPDFLTKPLDQIWSIVGQFPIEASVSQCIFPWKDPWNTSSSASARCQRLAASPWGSRFHPSVSWHIWQFSGAEVLSREFKYTNINRCIWQKGTYLYIYIYIYICLSLSLYTYIYIFHSYPRDPNILISLQIHPNRSKLTGPKQLNWTTPIEWCPPVSCYS